MGRPKALLPVDRSGESFIGRIIRVLRNAGQDDVIVVVGHDAQVIAASVGAILPPPRIVVNARYGEGQLSSLHAALEVVDRPGVDGMLVTLVDVPLVSEGTVRAVVEAYSRTRAPIVRPVQDGRHGHPVVFDRAVFDELRRSDPGIGAKAVVRAHVSEMVEVPVDDVGAFTDIDTPEDYRRLIGPLPQGA
jgi:molybdenum cofactor cytidylyltransferase